MSVMSKFVFPSIDAKTENNIFGSSLPFVARPKWFVALVDWDLPVTVDESDSELLQDIRRCPGGPGGCPDRPGIQGTEPRRTGHGHCRR